MHRHANHERCWSSAAHGCGRNGIAAQVNAGGAARKGDVEAIVDEDAGRTAARHGDQFLDDIRELRCLEIALAELQVVDAGVDGMTGLLDEAAPYRAAVRRSAGQPMPIRDELQDQGSTRESVGASSRPPRPEKIGASSATPTSRLTNPRPLMPPRTNELVTNGRRIGQFCAK
jgi:hypothetical protein